MVGEAVREQANVHICMSITSTFVFVTRPRTALKSMLQIICVFSIGVSEPF
jgi:hypothetical protein